MAVFIIVVLVPDVWCIKFTYGRIFYGYRNLFIHKKVIPKVDTFFFLVSMNLIKEIFLGTIS